MMASWKRTNSVTGNGVLSENCVIEGKHVIEKEWRKPEGN